jgi:capsular polysaccharide transport system permease protein
VTAGAAMGNTISESVRIQGRVLLALVLREARTRYGRRRAGYLWALIEPLIHITIFYFLFKYIRSRHIAIGDSLFVFLATGFVVFLGFRGLMGRIQGGYSSNQALLAFPPVQMFDVFLGRAILEIATWMLVTIILFFGMVLYGAPFPVNVLKMISAIILLSGIAFGIGACIGMIGEFIPSIANFVKAPMRILYFASAIFYLPDAMPPKVRGFLYWNPVLHGITLFREGYYKGYKSDILDVNYLAIWSVCCVFVAFIVERAVRKPIRNIA